MAIVNESALGKETAYPGRYDKSLLFRIPREENRLKYGINPDKLPFAGWDVWNAYEVSFLTNSGLPVSRIMKMICPAESLFLVESKSLKLYLNSFNMEPCGNNADEAIEHVSNTIQKDLEELLETNIQVRLFDMHAEANNAFENYPDLISLIPANELDSLELTRFTESPDLLKFNVSDITQNIIFRTDLLRSNCPVTNQPDWGDLYISMDSKCNIDLPSVVAYLVSFRKENHFHEEVAEMIFSRFAETFKPEKLMVAAMYTRRGGIDINPVRATNAGMIPEVFCNYEKLLAKTWRQ